MGHELCVGYVDSLCRPRPSRLTERRRRARWRSAEGAAGPVVRRSRCSLSSALDGHPFVRHAVRHGETFEVAWPVAAEVLHPGLLLLVQRLRRQRAQITDLVEADPDAVTDSLTDFVVDPGASVLTGKVSVDGEVAAESAPLFFLDGRTVNPLAVEGQVATLEGTTVKLKAEAADLLNQTFEIDALTEGLVIGIAKITLDVPAA